MKADMVMGRTMLKPEYWRKETEIPAELNTDQLKRETGETGAWQKC